MHQQLQQAREAAVDRSIPRQTAKILQPHATSLDADLQEAAQAKLFFTVVLLWTPVNFKLFLTLASTRFLCLGWSALVPLLAH